MEGYSFWGGGVARMSFEKTNHSCNQQRQYDLKRFSYLEKDSLRLWISDIRTVRKEDSTTNENQSDYKHGS